MNMTPDRRISGPMKPNDRLIPANVCTGGNLFSCIATGTIAPSRYERCENRSTAGCASSAWRMFSISAVS